MQITYHFLDEDVSIDVTEEWGSLLIDLDRQEYNNNHKETRRHTSLNTRGEDGEWLASSMGLDEPFIRQASTEEIRAAIKQLSVSQRALLNKVYFERRSLVSIAAEECVDKSAISHRMERIYKKLKKLLR